MKILVTGGRAYNNQRAVFEYLTRLDGELPGGIDLVIQGGAEGADKHARLWACANQRPCATFHAHWHTLGKAAGPLRNEWMLEFARPDIVIAFPGGKGTSNMVTLARRAGINVRTITP